MANYDWREFQGRSWFDRFPQDVRGYATWRQQRFEQRVDLRVLAADVIEAREQAPKGLQRPCVFVSHRRSDVAQATRIAYLACAEGFDYWLDVLDPTVSLAASNNTSSTEQTAAATAAVIEMALLNSSHVLAVITPSTKGSQWVPYEYGRVKTPEVKSLQAASWVDKAVAATVLPEYLHLGPILKSELDIRQWLKTELQKQPGRWLVERLGKDRFQRQCDPVIRQHEESGGRLIEDHRQLRSTLRGWAGPREGQEIPEAQIPLAFEQYKLYVEMTDRISERRQTANSFFVAVNTGVVALLGYVGPDRQPLRAERVYFLIAVAGIILCLLWYRIVRSYRDLNTARFAVIHAMEEVLPMKPYAAEWEHVGHGHESRLYKPLTHIEAGVPWLFFVLYCGVFLSLIFGA